MTNSIINQEARNQIREYVLQEYLAGTRTATAIMKQLNSEQIEFRIGWVTGMIQELSRTILWTGAEDKIFTQEDGFKLVGNKDGSYFTTKLGLEEIIKYYELRR